MESAMTRSSRRLAARALPIAVMVGALVAGCGSQPASVGDPNAPLEVWTRSNDDQAKVYRQLFADFTAKTGIQVDYKPLFTDFDTQLQNRAAAKDLPDVIINDTGSLGLYQSQGLVTEVDRNGIAGGADVTDAGWQAAAASDGKYYGVPFSTQAFVTLIRKDWREKLAKPVPENWDQLLDLAIAFTTQDPDGNGRNDTYGMLVPGTTERGYLAWWASNYLFEAGGDIIADAGGGKYRVAIDTPQSVAAVQWLRGLFCDSKVVQPGALTVNTNDAHPFFESGKAGIYHTGPYMFGRFDKSLGRDKYEVIAAPRGPAGSTVLSEGENAYLMAGSARQDAQRRLAEYLITADAQRIGMRSDPQPSVRLPVNGTVDVGAAYNDPRWALVAEVRQKNSKPFPNLPNFQPFRQKTAEGLNAIFATCANDVPAQLGTLAGDLRDELEAQGVAA